MEGLALQQGLGRRNLVGTIESPMGMGWAKILAEPIDRVFGGGQGERKHNQACCHEGREV